MAVRTLAASALAVIMSLLAIPVVAAEPDRYVDAIAPATTAMVVDPANLLGAPDGRSATVNGRLGARLVVDLGAGENGVGDLLIHFTGRTLAQQTQLYFLTATIATIATTTLTMIGLGPRIARVPNSSTTPYRLIRIDAGSTQSFIFDAIETTALA